MPDIDVDFEDGRRDEVIAYVSREVRPGPRRPDHHVRHDARPGRDPRRRPRARPLATAKSTASPRRSRTSSGSGSTRRSKPRPSSASMVDARPGGQAGHRVRPAARGRGPQRVDACGRRRHQPRAADGAHAAPEGDELRLADDPVRDARDRGAGPAEVRLPRPVEPDDPAPGGRPGPREPGRSRSTSTRSRSTTRRRSSCSHRARRPASSSWSRRACAATSASCARRRSTTSPRWSRSTARARWTTSPPTSAASTARSAVTYLHPLLEPYLEKTYGIFVYQEDIMAAAIALGGFTGPEADTLGYAIRKKKSSVLRAQKEKFVTQAAERGVEPRRHRRGVQGLRALRAVRLQQGPRDLLRAHRLPDGLSEGELHRRVHDQRADGVPLERGEGRRRDRRVPPARHRGAPAGRPRQPPRVHRRGRRDPLRAARGQERRAGRDRVDHRGARRGRPVQVAHRLLLADRPAPGEPEGARVAGPGRGAQRVRPSRPGPARARRRGGRRPGHAARPDQRADVAVRHGRRGGGRPSSARSRRPPRCRSASGCAGRRSCSGCTSPSIRWARSPSRSATSSTPIRAISGTSPSTGSGSSSAGS